MELNADRLAKLAGLSSRKRANLNEASNVSYHDGDNSDDPEFRHGKHSSQLSEGEHEQEKSEDVMYEDPNDDADDERGEDAELPEGSWGGNADDEHRSGKGPHHVSGGGKYGKGGHRKDFMKEKHDDDLVEIDEAMLEAEINKMRKERLQENELRLIIRNEVASIVSQMKKSTKTSNVKNRNTTSGITKGFAGPGFN